MANLTARIIEAVVAASCVVGAIFCLSVLEDMPMPKAGSFVTLRYLEDVKFYAPPMGAIAVILFSAQSLPALSNMAIGTFLTTLGSFTLVFLLGPGRLTRSLAAGLAMFHMKMTGRIYAPAGAFAVLLVDNAKMQELGIFYVLMPGMTGTAVLVALAALRLQILEALRPTFKRCDPEGNYTGALLPVANKKS